MSNQTIDLTPSSWYYSKERLTGLLTTFVLIAIGIAVILASKSFPFSFSSININNMWWVNGLIWGVIGYVITVLGVSLIDLKNQSQTNPFPLIKNLMTDPINFVSIASIWILIGTLLTSKYQWSSKVIIIYGIIAGYLNHGLPL